MKCYLRNVYGTQKNTHCNFNRFILQAAEEHTFSRVAQILSSFACPGKRLKNDIFNLGHDVILPDKGHLETNFPW